MRVIGTAGHIDHGKSTLVRALTGIDPDRLKEEKARGMTIDLGFAWMELPLMTEHATPVGIVDVPGHLDFIKNMLAGVGGIDAAVLVIAADEGVMPQTREHLAILDLLAVPALVVALTKVDAVDDPEWLDLVEVDVHDLLDDTRFTGASVVRVAALQGLGLAELRAALTTVLRELPPRRNRNVPRLPIDRVFTLAGFGTVVTGTLSDGGLVTGQPVEVQPGAKPARIRGMHAHNRPIEAAEPGSRVALNLTGVAADEIKRGQVVTIPGAIQATLLIDVAFRLLADAPAGLKHNSRVDLFIGSSEAPARVRVLGTELLEPGAQGFLQLRLEHPTVAVAGDHFILRQPSPSRTLGGGVVLEPHPRRRWRRFDPAVIARLKVLDQGVPEEVVAQALSRQPFSSRSQVSEASGLDVDTASAALSQLGQQGALVVLGRNTDELLLLLEDWNALRDYITAVVRDYHGQFPLRRGLARGEVRSKLSAFALGGRRNLGLLPVRVYNALLDSFSEAGVIAGDEQLVWIPDFTPELSPVQSELVRRTLRRLADAGFAPPAVDELMASLGNDQALLDMLLEQGHLVRVGGNLIYRREEFEAMVGEAQARLATHGTLTLAEARDLWDTSRKYAQAVLEEMDARRITRREGDVRILR